MWERVGVREVRRHAERGCHNPETETARPPGIPHPPSPHPSPVRERGGCGGVSVGTARTKKPPRRIATALPFALEGRQRHKATQTPAGGGCASTGLATLSPARPGCSPFRPKL